MAGKTRIQTRTDVLLDLKMTTEVSVGELNRCIELSVADLTRYLPKEEVREFKYSPTVADEAVTMPVDTDVDRIVTSYDLSSAAAGLSLSIAGQPDAPRVLTITINDSNISITGMSFIIQGTDRDDLALTEYLHFTFGMHSAGESTTLTGLKEFKTVRSIEINQISGSSPGDTMTVGVGSMHGVHVELANKPLKFESETSVTFGGTVMTRGTDYVLDYMRGTIATISGSSITTGGEVTISYEKDEVTFDIECLADLIRIQRVEYPVGNIPQNFCQWDVWKKYLIITGRGEDDPQEALVSGTHARVYYDAEHIPPNEYAVGSVPDFLQPTVDKLVSSYALMIYALKQDLQTETDLGSMRTALGAANTAHTALGTALTNVKKYLDNNSDADAAGLLADITSSAADLRTAVETALDGAQAYLAEVDTTDLQGAEGVQDNYKATTNYLDGGSAPDVKKYLDDGDAFLDGVNKGGVDQTVPEAHLRFAQTVRDALIAPFEVERADMLKTATARTNAAMGFVQEAAQRMSNLRSYIEQASGYSTVANTFAREAEARLTEINGYLTQAMAYGQGADRGIVLAERYRAEAIDRRNEVFGIWRDRKQLIGDLTSSSVRQMPEYNR